MPISVFWSILGTVGQIYIQQADKNMVEDLTEIVLHFIEFLQFC